MLQNFNSAWDIHSSIFLNNHQQYINYSLLTCCYSLHELNNVTTIFATPIFYSYTYKLWALDNYNYFFLYYTYLKDLYIFRSLYSNFVSTVLPFWFKMTFRGKGFSVRNFLNNSNITFNFGRSHWTNVYIPNNYTLVINIRSQNYIFMMFNFKPYLYLRSLLRLVNPINCYTNRGLRLKKQVIGKRFGNVSQMISSLHF